MFKVRDSWDAPRIWRACTILQRLPDGVHELLFPNGQNITASAAAARINLLPYDMRIKTEFRINRRNYSLFFMPQNVFRRMHAKCNALAQTSFDHTRKRTKVVKNHFFPIGRHRSGCRRAFRAPNRVLLVAHFRKRHTSNRASHQKSSMGGATNGAAEQYLG